MLNLWVLIQLILPYNAIDLTLKCEVIEGVNAPPKVSIQSGTYAYRGLPFEPAQLFHNF